MPAVKPFIKAYLETYGQPQCVAAIREYGLQGAQAEDLQAELDEMAEAGEIYRLEDGVDAGGNTMVWYGPVASA